ncbi:hypothetical protein D3C77_457210 [compost metagenome]
MEHCIKVIFGEQGVQRMGISDVQFDPFDDRPGGGSVCNYYVVASTEQVLDHVRTDVACAADNQKLHPNLLASVGVQTVQSALTVEGQMAYFKNSQLDICLASKVIR